MLHHVASVSHLFQWFTILHGISMQHECDMGRLLVGSNSLLAQRVNSLLAQRANRLARRHKCRPTGSRSAGFCSFVPVCRLARSTVPTPTRTENGDSPYGCCCPCDASLPPARLSAVECRRASGAAPSRPGSTFWAVDRRACPDIPTSRSPRYQAAL